MFKMFKNNSEKLRLSDGDFSIEDILKRLDLPKKEKILNLIFVKNILNKKSMRERFIA